MTTRTPRADSRANRAGILDAARTALAQDPNASVDTIARSAGLSRRTLYGHFDDRDALIRQLIVTGAQRFNALAESVTDPDPRRALARLAALLWHEAAHLQVAAAVALDEAHVVQTAEALAPLRRSVSGIVQRGQADGTFRADIAAPTLSRLIEEISRTVVSRPVVDHSVVENSVVENSVVESAADLVVRALLSIAGLSWRETDALLQAHPDILVVPERGE